MLNNGVLLVFPFIIGGLILVIFLVFIRNKKEKDKKNFPNDWKNFEKALVLKDIRGVGHYGDLVLWNESLSYKNVVFMHTELQQLDQKYDVLEKLKQNVFNKKLHIERHTSSYS